MKKVTNNLDFFEKMAKFYNLTLFWEQKLYFEINNIAAS